MKSFLLPVAVCALLLSGPAPAGDTGASKSMPFTSDNPFAKPSTLPLQLPPFDKIKDEHFRPAFEAGMAEELKEMDVIAREPAAPTFDNTIVAMERAGQLLNRVNTVFGNLNASNTNDEIQAIDTEMSPKLAAHADEIYLNSALFKRVDTLFQQRDSLKLDAESATLLERYHTRFVRAGARLSDADKVRLRGLNEKISALTTQFQQNVLKSTKDDAVVVDKASDLDGLSAEQIGAAAQAAKGRGLEGKWLISLRNTTQQPVLSQLKNRALRERVHKASSARSAGGSADTTALIAQIVKLRAQHASLLGYANHAAEILSDETAGTPEAVNKILAQLAPAAVANAKQEAADIQKVIDAEARAAGRKSFKLQPWDWQYYTEIVRKARFDFDESQVKPYFELNHVLQDGVFYAAHELYGLSFKERHDLPVYQADVRVFDVFDADGSQLGLFLADFFARDNKQGGAWMNEYVSQSRLFNRKPVVVNNLNIVKPAAGQPVLVTFDEVTTMFHEFGHGLHGLFSSVQYPALAGTNVPRDFVEYPSQYNEMWAVWPSVLANYARHYQTGELLPKALLDKVLAAGKFNEGFKTTEYLAASLLDQSWHQISEKQAPAADQVMAFEAAALKKAGVDYAPVPPRYHSAYFLHVFSGGYSAGYYAYLWSEILARDTEHWFKTHGGLLRANGDYLRAKVLSRGRSDEPKRIFSEFYGGEPEIGPLLEHRGLSLPRK